ncbi:MAG TPA: hypothetical protein VGV64_07060, partial [Thermoplasmata archaeon]|nr:hypothetical protein [Thermoplasmata archaeon]
TEARRRLDGAMANPPVDLGDAELVDWRVEGKEAMVRIRIEEGATIELRFLITNVYRIGNDPNTGAPNDLVQSQNLMRLVNFDKKLRRRPDRDGPPAAE